MPSLSLQLKDIPDEGLHLSRRMELSDLGLRGEEFTIQTPLTLAVQVFRIGKQARAEGSLCGAVFYECVRCLREFEDKHNIAFTVLFQESNQDSRQEEKGKSQDTKDTLETERFPMANGQLELGEMLREHLILMAPMKPLCQSDCLGLCPVCRFNRNITNCGCQEIKTVSPFSNLPQLINVNDHANIKKSTI